LSCAKTTENVHEFLTFAMTAFGSQNIDTFLCQNSAIYVKADTIRTFPNLNEMRRRRTVVVSHAAKKK
jgi:hypothetical protein